MARCKFKPTTKSTFTPKGGEGLTLVFPQSPGGAPDFVRSAQAASRGRRRTRNFTHVRLQGRGRRRNRQCRPRDARDPRRAPLSRLRSGRARLPRLDRPRGLVRRQDAQVQGARALRLFRHRHLPHVGRRRGVEGIFAEDRRAGLRRHRQFVGLADGPGRAADRARGQRGGGQGLRQEEHHRQPELLDGAARRGAEAAARPRDHQAGGRRDLPVGLGRGQGRDGRTLRADARRVRVRSGRAEEVPEAHRLQRHSRDRRLHGRRLDQGRVEDDDGDQEDPRPQDQADRDLCPRPGVHRPFGSGQRRVRRADQRRRSARDPAQGAWLPGHRPARARRLRHPP